MLSSRRAQWWITSSTPALVDGVPSETAKSKGHPSRLRGVTSVAMDPLDDILGDPAFRDVEHFLEHAGAAAESAGETADSGRPEASARSPSRASCLVVPGSCPSASRLTCPNHLYGAV